jgi:predicted Zn-dependent protease
MIKIEETAERTGGIGVLMLAALVGCQTVQTTGGGAVGVDRPQTMTTLISSEEFNEKAAAEYRQTLREASSKGQLNQNAAQVERVRHIANRLIPNTVAFRSDAPRWSWEVNVITSNEVNAWCMPGGKIAVYTGLLAKLGPTDDELAAVMGHEISHALREHSREQYSQALAQGILINILGAVTGASAASQSAGQTVLDVMMNLPHSRTDETEADRIGVELAARSGYDPRAAVSLWEKMGKLGGSKPPQFLSTHPSDESRMADLRVYADKVLPLYDSAHTR